MSTSASESGAAYSALPSDPPPATEGNGVDRPQPRWWEAWKSPPLLSRPSGRWSPEESASPLSRLTFAWITPLLLLGNSKPLQAGDLYDLPPWDKATVVAPKLADAWAEQLELTRQGKKKQPALWAALWVAFAGPFWWAGLLKVFHDCCALVTPVILQRIVRLLDAPPAPHLPLAAAAAAAAAPTLGAGIPRWAATAAANATLLLPSQAAAAAAAAAASGAAGGLPVLPVSPPTPPSIFTLIFFPILTLFQPATSTGPLGAAAAGDAGAAPALPLWLQGLLLSLLMLAFNQAQSILVQHYFFRLFRLAAHVNLQSNDAEKLSQLVVYLHVLWSGPLQIAGSMVLLFRVLGVLPALSGLAVMLLLMPFNGVLTAYLSAVRKRLIGRTDARVKLLSEAVAGIRAIKLNGWEPLFRAKIERLRDAEMKEITFAEMLDILTLYVYYVVPLIVSVTSLACYSLMGRPLTAEVAFPALALFNILRFPLALIPDQINELVQARVSVDRLEKFLQLPDMTPVLPEAAAPVGSIEVKGASFTWAGEGDDGEGGKEKEGHEEAEKEGEKKALLGGQASDEPPQPQGAASGLQVTVEGATAAAGSEAAASGPSGEEGPAAGAGSSAPPFLTLQDISLEVPQGQLVIVVGKVGSGKSSLLSALLGEIRCVSGSVHVTGSVAYTAQDPWICNATVQDNILMGAPLDEARYQRALEVCALAHDLAVLPGGDKAEIGERGINLSGGQKHRVALARAVYAAADVYLLDDPLSAVDVHVGRHLFEQCVCGELRSRTRVLVTHQLQYAEAADVILVVDGGRIVDRGTYEELQGRGVDLQLVESLEEEVDEAESGNGGDRGGREGGPPQSDPPATSAVPALAAEGAEGAPTEAGTGTGSSAEAAAATANASSSSSSSATAVNDLKQPLLQDSSSSSSSSSAPSTTTNSSGSSSAPAGPSPAPKAGQLVKDEERAVGRVRMSVYGAYFRAWGGPCLLLPLLVLLLFALAQALRVACDGWLTVWTARTSAGDTRTGLYLGVYAAITMVSALVLSLRALCLTLGCLAAARTLHSRLLSRVLRLPLAFFDSQPSGRLLNRFTRDVEQMDLSLSGVIFSFLACALQVLFALSVMIFITPLVLVPLIPLLYIYLQFQIFYLSASRELKRIDSLARSPIFAHFGETLHGLSTVRAFKMQEAFSARNAARLEASTAAYLASQGSNRWLSFRLELLGTICVFATAVFCSIGALAPTGGSRGGWAAGFAGLALTNAFTITGFMSWLVRQHAAVETQMNSVERVLEYSQLPTEAADIIEDHRPPADWPSRGRVVASEVVLRYRPELPPVLKGISFEMRAGEKLGVCGRTGCGKTTLVMALFRAVELESGSFEIDSINAASIGLQDLRRRLALVPQDPVIFAGSVRWNLDPFSEAPNGDSDLWEALQQAGVADAVRALPGGAGLDYEVAEGGSNLSSGQRQLLCLARALLRRSKVLVLDEATSNVDTATDAAIRAAVRGPAFADCSILTIAHRLHTIVECDRVMLLDAGRVAEMGSPADLLANGESQFSAFVRHTMPQQASLLKKIASASALNALSAQ